MNGNMRSSLMALVGAYLLYTAYELYEGLMRGSTLPRALHIFFIIFFALGGIAVFVYAYRLWKKSKEGKDQEEDKKAENDQEMK